MSSKKRIMLLEVTPLVPQPIEYATLDPAFLDAAVTLSESNLRATAGATTFGRTRSTIPLSNGEYYWEVELAVAGTSGYVSSQGLMQEDMSSSGGELGFDGYNSAAAPYWLSGNGYFYWNSSLISGPTSFPAATIVRNWYNADTGVYKVAINGGSWITMFSRALSSQILFFVGCTVARNTSFRFNFGASAFAYDVPSTSRAGVYTQPDPVPTTLCLSSSAFNTESSGKNPDTGYLARISSKTDLETSREASCYVWNSQSRSSRGSLSLVNTDGALDEWSGYIWRDAPAIVLSGYEGDSRASFIEESNESVESVSRDSKFFKINFIDPLAQLDLAVPRSMYSASNANSVTINTPYPKTFGNPQYCRGVFRSTATTGNDAFAIDFSDDVLDVVTVFDKGDIFDHLPSGGHRDFYMTQDSSGPKLQNVPAGTITAHPVGPFLYDDTGTDRIVGGNPFVWGGVQPNNWTLTGTVWTVTNRFQDGAGFGYPGGARCRISGSQSVAMYNSATSLAAGKYVIRFNVYQMSTPGLMYVALGSEARFFRVDRVGMCEIAITSTATAQLVFGGGVVGGYSLGSADFYFGEMEAFDASVPEYLPEWMDLFCEQYAGVSIDSASISSFAADLNFRLAHFSDKEETILSILRQSLDGWIGWIIPKRDGEITVGRVRDPDLETADYSFSAPQIRSVIDEEDKAPGLTTRIAGRRNYSPTTVDQIAAGATATVKSELQKDFLIIRSARAERSAIGFLSSAREVVSPQFRQADGSPPKETMLQDEDAIQTIANVSGTLWTPDRKFYYVDLILDAAISSALEPGQIINITWNRFNLESGKNMLLLSVKTGFWKQNVRLKLWR
jgi:hypothetical protein